jgi:hypothetical protein
VTNVFEAPPQLGLVLTKGADCLFTLVYKPLVTDVDGEPVLADGQRQFVEAPFPAGASVTVTIETNPPSAENLESEATITGSRALVWIQSEDTDPIPVGKLWRARLSLADGTDLVLCNGKTSRSDG